jgi:hypothetical protein
MRYFRAYQYLFESPNWLQNLLIGMLATLVPIVGPMVLTGYHYEIIEALHLRGEGDYPDFDFNRLVNYLMRGLWVFIVQLIVTLPFVLVAMVFWLVLSLLIAVTQSNSRPDSGPPVLLFVGMALWFVILLVGILAVGLVSVPMSLRAGLAQDLGAAFSWPFIRDFVGRMWLETILVHLFLAVSGTLIMLAGLLLFCVGVYPAGALVGFAQAHLIHQLYELYLQRGGTAIPLKVERV